MHLLRPKFESWHTEVLTCSALEMRGIDTIWETTNRAVDALRASGELTQLRAAQATAWMWSELRDSLLDDLRKDARVGAMLPDLEARVGRGEITPTRAARELLHTFGAGG